MVQDYFMSLPVLMTFQHRAGMSAFRYMLPVWQCHSTDLSHFTANVSFLWLQHCIIWKGYDRVHMGFVVTFLSFIDTFFRDSFMPETS